MSLKCVSRRPLLTIHYVFKLRNAIFCLLKIGSEIRFNKSTLSLSRLIFKCYFIELAEARMKHYAGRITSLSSEFATCSLRGLMIHNDTKKAVEFHLQKRDRIVFMLHEARDLFLAKT